MPTVSSAALSATPPSPWSHERSPAPAGRGRGFGLRQPSHTSRWYASLMLDRLMFIYFVQRKRFLNGEQRYLRDRLARCQRKKDRLLPASSEFRRFKSSQSDFEEAVSNHRSECQSWTNYTDPLATRIPEFIDHGKPHLSMNIVQSLSAALEQQ